METYCLLCGQDITVDVDMSVVCVNCMIVYVAPRYGVVYAISLLTEQVLGVCSLFNQ